MTNKTFSALSITMISCLTLACCLVGWLINQHDERALQYAQLAVQVDGGSVDANEPKTVQQPDQTTTTATTDTVAKPTTFTYKLQAKEFPLLLMRACGETNEAKALKDIKALNPQITNWDSLSFKKNQEFTVPCNLNHSMVLAVQPKKKATAKA